MTNRQRIRLLLSQLGPLTIRQVFDEGVGGSWSHLHRLLQDMEERRQVERAGEVGGCRATLWRLSSG